MAIDEDGGFELGQGRSGHGGFLALVCAWSAQLWLSTKVW
jgi:hypothetical protein